MTRLELIRAAAGRPRRPAGEVLSLSKRKPHPLQRTHTCAMCRSGFALMYGRHTVRHSGFGVAWCAACSRFVSYSAERFVDHFAAGKMRHRSCAGAGQPIPAWEGR